MRVRQQTHRLSDMSSDEPAADLCIATLAYTIPGAPSIDAPCGLVKWCVQAHALADALEPTWKTEVAVLDWQHRRALILAEIKRELPDILCLQELQGNAAGAGADDHHAALRKELKPSGYDGRYVRKMKRNGCGWPHCFDCLPFSAKEDRFGVNY